MSNDKALMEMALWFCFFISGVVVGCLIMNTMWERDAVEKGHAQYDSQTGKWQWKDRK